MPPFQEPNLDVLLDDLVQRAVKLLDEPYEEGWTLPTRGGDGEVELIEGRADLTVLFEMQGYKENELHLSMSDDELELRAPGTIVRRGLPCRVVPGSEKSEYHNGILWVRVLKAV